MLAVAVVVVVVVPVVAVADSVVSAPCRSADWLGSDLADDSRSDEGLLVLDSSGGRDFVSAGR